MELAGNLGVWKTKIVRRKNIVVSLDLLWVASVTPSKEVLLPSPRTSAAVDRLIQNFLVSTTPQGGILGLRES